METASTGPLKIDVAPCEQQGEVLRLLFRHLAPDAQLALVTTLLAGSAAGALPMAGLLRACRGDQLVGATWVQIQPGKTGVLWPPRLEPNGDPDTAQQLMAAANDFLSRHQVSLAQTLLEDPHSTDAELLVQNGYTHLADLLYLVSTEAFFPTEPPHCGLEFEPYSDRSRARLKAIVEQTYEHTADCPELNGSRDLEDVLTGYQATGVFSPEHWRIVRAAGEDVGCLLLADHPDAEQIELVYMGVVPAARGRGLGFQAAKYAQLLAHEAGRPRLVLAVDARNAPALGMYAAADFLRWDQRSVFVRVM